MSAGYTFSSSDKTQSNIFQYIRGKARQSDGISMQIKLVRDAHARKKAGLCLA